MFDKLRFGTRFILFAVLVAFAPGAMALGLGNLSVESYLNQPLRARIDLIVRENDDIDSLTAKLASADDFALIGVSREAISVPLRFAIDQDEQGRFVQITSKLPVADPVVRIIVEVNWSSGRMLREYTLFLDPPTFTAAAPAPAVDQHQQAPAVRSTREQEPEVVEGDELVDEAVYGTLKAESPAGQTDGDEYGPVRAGQTLWSIAADWSRGTGLDMNTAMIAIQRNNPHAFINNNINLLKSGSILRMPQMDGLAQISPEEARADVAQQHQALHTDLAAPVVETPLVDDERSETAAVPSQAQTVQTDGQLELVPPSESSEAESAYGLEETAGDATASTAVETLREELARKEEALIVEQQQNQYLQDRISELESQVTTEQPGSIVDDSLSAMESRLQEERLSPDTEQATDAAKKEELQVVRPQPREQESWFRGKLAWLIGLLFLGVALGGWFLSRRSSRNVLVSDLGAREGGTERDIKRDAEKTFKVLKPVENKTNVVKLQEAPAGQAGAPGMAATARPPISGQVEDAAVLDEDSADPEVRLDLARAYIAMGDKEAARVILAEVIEHGNANQQKEAKAMLGEI
ncbi:MAG TPA: FimV/HubP family polar landmark protein [Xanthomonadales bacterium]|nr:FimV/HubP family polar landmark protein [Xanthomonadales bacterium]